MMNNQGFLQIPFAWLFAFIVGAFILFIAIYASVNIIDTGETQVDAQTAKQIGILLNPLETGFETGKTNSLNLGVDTRIFNRCNNNGDFGRQIIKVSQKSFNKWTETDVDVGFSNKYIFSDNFVEGKKFFLFSKPFDFPFKVSDLIYLTSSEQKYCFNNPPKEIQDEILSLNQENILLENCPTNSVKVCFNSGTNCDVVVNYDSRYVDKIYENKDNERMYFHTDALMYAAVFSEKEIYECQLRRVMQRGKQLTQLYIDKANFISKKKCNSNLDQDLLSLLSLENGFSSSENFNNLMIDLTEKIETRNKIAECKLW
jgi:hypothetical protein